MNENVLVFAGIIVGVAVADQLANLHRLLRQRETVRWDWLLLWVAAAVLMTQIQVWWGLAGQPEGAITIGKFLPQVVLLILLFLLSCASLPDVGDKAGIDLRAYYDQHSRYIWILFTLAFAWVLGTELVSRVSSGSLQGFGWVAELVILGIMASMAVVRKRWWHVVGLAILTYTGPLGWLARSLA